MILAKVLDQFNTHCKKKRPLDTCVELRALLACLVFGSERHCLLSMLQSILCSVVLGPLADCELRTRLLQFCNVHTPVQAVLERRCSSGHRLRCSCGKSARSARLQQLFDMLLRVLGRSLQIVQLLAQIRSIFLELLLLGEELVFELIWRLQDEPDSHCQHRHACRVMCLGFDDSLCWSTERDLHFSATFPNIGACW